ncbi:putative sulfatase [Variovorax paradoxus B4]|uniref:Putative sulfatase n=2 Tax=Variovorax paradoxus TaxID=34073 RepID=T1XMC6_VARPD|nr:putative sulfatase [Variovorax paradoxus B4]
MHVHTISCRSSTPTDQTSIDRDIMSNSTKSRRPNIIVILTDDMGHGDLSSYGSTLVETKNIDSIGRDGVRFTAGYSSAPLCSPSRAGLVTGRYQQRFGFEQQVSSGAYPEQREVRLEDGSLAPLQGEAEFLRRGIPTTEKNIGEVFKAAGYATGVFGKWHLGHGPQFLPHNRGFDESVVFYGNTSLQSIRPDDPDLVNVKVDYHDEAKDTAWTREGLNAVRRNGEVIDVDQYLMFFFRDELVKFIDRMKDEPFMVYFPVNSPVPPLQVPKRLFDQLKDRIPNIAQRAYNAFLLALDEVVGSVLDAVRRNGLENDTLIIFVSDNGNALSRPGSNAPFSGGKYSTYEGGIRMPFMMKWPGHIRAGQVYEQPVSTLDILPTVAAAGEVPTTDTQPLDGVNLLPWLKDEKQGAPHEALFWKLAAYSGVRVGDWKLYLEPKNGVAQLFHLGSDPGEKVDMKTFRPEIFQLLLDRYMEWDKSLPPRAWTNISPVFRK